MLRYNFGHSYDQRQGSCSGNSRSFISGSILFRSLLSNDQSDDPDQPLFIDENVADLTAFCDSVCSKDVSIQQLNNSECLAKLDRDLSSLMQKLAQKSRTAKLWVQ